MQWKLAVASTAFSRFKFIFSFLCRILGKPLTVERFTKNVHKSLTGKFSLFEEEDSFNYLKGEDVGKIYNILNLQNISVKTLYISNVQHWNLNNDKNSNFLSNIKKLANSDTIIIDAKTKGMMTQRVYPLCDLKKITSTTPQL